MKKVRSQKEMLAFDVLVIEHLSPILDSKDEGLEDKGNNDGHHNLMKANTSQHFSEPEISTKRVAVGEIEKKCHTVICY